MKKLSVLLIALILTLSLTACGRKNEAKNLQIKSHKDTEYVIKYVKSDLEFGELYLVIKDEALVSFYTLSDKEYVLKESQIKIGGLSVSNTKTEDDNDKKLKTTFTLPNPLKFVEEVDKEGKETINEKTISFYVKFVDKDKDTEGATDLKDDSQVTLSVSTKSLLEFIRNKTIEE